MNQSIALTRVTDFILDNAKVNTFIKTDDDKQGLAVEESEDTQEDSNLETEDAEE